MCTIYPIVLKIWKIDLSWHISLRIRKPTHITVMYSKLIVRYVICPVSDYHALAVVHISILRTSFKFHCFHQLRNPHFYITGYIRRNCYDIGPGLRGMYFKCRYDEVNLL